MEQRIFPGANRKKELAEKKAARRAFRNMMKVINQDIKQKEKERKKQLNQDMGHATRMLILRRGFNSFILAALMGIGVGSSHWLGQQHNPNAQSISYKDAFKRAYNIKNLNPFNTPISDSVYTWAAMLLLVMAVLYSRHHMAKDKRIAQLTIDDLKLIDKDWFKEGFMSDMFEVKHGAKKTYEFDPLWKMHPVCLEIIKKIAGENPQFFESLINGVPQGTTREYAITVIKSHLLSNPQDAERVYQTFKYGSIPTSLKDWMISRLPKRTK